MTTETLAAIKSEVLADAGAAPQPAPAADAPGAAPAAPAFDRATEAKGWAQLPKAVGQVLAMALPELADVYNDRDCLAWGEAMADLAHEHGWSAKILGPWVGVALASVPFIVPTYMAVKMRRDPQFAEAVRAARSGVAPAPPTAEPAPAAFDNGAEVRKVSKVAPVG